MNTSCRPARPTMMPLSSLPRPILARYSGHTHTLYSSSSSSEKLKYILIQELTVAGVSALIEADYNPIRGIGADRWSAV